MIPKYELSEYSLDYIRDKVAQWIPSEDEMDSTVNDIPVKDLSLSLPPELMGGYYNRLKREISPKDEPGVTPAKRKKRQKEDSKKSYKLLKDQVIKIYEIILDILEGDRFRISSHYNFSETEKNNILRALNNEGFIVNESDFYDIIEVAESIVENKLHNGNFFLNNGRQSRHASLNCYDYECLKDEMNKLEWEIGISEIRSSCPTLYQIYMDALNNEGSKYPGRHLPYYNIFAKKEQSTVRYQCLRMIDEILCSNINDYYFNHSEMETAMKELAESYGISYRDNLYQNWRPFDSYSLTDSEFGHLYDILKQLISIGHSSGNVKNYERDVFETNKSQSSSLGKFKKNGARRYKKMPNGKRLSAFAVDIAIPEIFKLRKEIGIIKAKFFDNDQEKFESMFPLIAILGNSEAIITNKDLSDEFLRDISSTDLKLAVYKSLKYSELKKKIKQLISLRLPISIKKGNDWQTVYPISIKDDTDKWILIARSVCNNRPLLISPEELDQSIEAHTEPFEEKNSINIEDRFIGTNDFLLDEPQDIIIELTDKGIEDVNNEKSAFGILSPQIMRTAKRIFNEYQKAGIITIEQVYINEDFLNEVFQLDKTAKLRSIEPESVRNLYLQFFEKKAGQKWRHLDERPQASKRIKVKKRNVEE